MSLSNTKLKGSANVSLEKGNGKNLEMFLVRKTVILSWLKNSKMVKPGKFDHLHLVFHFTVPLSILRNQAPSIPFFEPNISYLKAVVLTSGDKFEKRDVWKFLLNENLLGIFCRVFKATLFKSLRIQSYWGH